VNHLTPAQLAELREELDAQLKRLERSIRVSGEAAATVTLDQTAVGRLSRMDSLQNQSLTKNLQEREQVKLAQLLEAFKRLEAGTFGLCVGCGGEIPFERLFVMPEAGGCGGCGG
jgi:DnaK suppressor protein